jgi:hypothetical protein
MAMRSKYASVAIALLCTAVVQVASASEYLGNNQRNGYTDATVPGNPVLLWTYKERHPPRPAWPESNGEFEFRGRDTHLCEPSRRRDRSWSCRRPAVPGTQFSSLRAFSAARRVFVMPQAARCSTTA